MAQRPHENWLLTEQYHDSSRLAARFERVTLHRYANTLVVTEAKPLIAYIVSMTPASATEIHERIRVRIGRCLQEYFASHNELRLTANVGLFEAW